VSLLLSVGGDGSCTLMTLTSGMQIISSCQQNLFNTNCGSFNGSLQILLTNPSQADPQNYRAPDIQAFLNQMGLGSITTIGNASSPPPPHPAVPGRLRTCFVNVLIFSLALGPWGLIHLISL
jgi:hypothetical protein